MRVSLLLVLLAVLLTACAQQPSGTSTSYQEQTVDGIGIGFEAADNAAINTEQVFIITLTGADGNPIEDASVYLDLTMPAMPMGANRPVAEYEGAGRYRAATAYTMTGEWEITVIIEIAGRESRAVFDRTVQ